MPRSLMWVVGDVAPGDEEILDATRRQLSRAGWQMLSPTPGVTPSAVLVWTRAGLQGAAVAAVEQARSVGTPIVLLGPTLGAGPTELTDASGMTPDRWSHPHSARLRADGSPAWQSRIAPLGEPIELATPVLSIDKVADPVDVLLAAHLGLTTHPVVMWNSDTRVGAFSLVVDADRADDVESAARILHLTLREILSLEPAEVAPLRVGLLGFGAIGAEHARAAEALPGLQLKVVCDRSAQRLAEAQRLFPGVTVTDDASTLLDDDTVDVVVVSTPDLDSAYRIFTILNDRGLDLSHSDILKSEIIGRIPAKDQDEFNKKWEDADATILSMSLSEQANYADYVTRKVCPA